MAVRISHCSTSIKNYYQVLEERVGGFINRGPKAGDLIYLAVRVGKTTLCGARYTLNEPTDYKPWDDAELYVNAMTIKDVQYCTPFDTSHLREIGGKYWAIKYFQSAKPIADQAAIDWLNREFEKNKTAQLVRFPEEAVVIEEGAGPAQETDPAIESITVSDSELEEIEAKIPEAKISIMGTFQTVPFASEQDPLRGLEKLVNETFHSLFPQFAEARTLLIAKNRHFLTTGFKIDGSNVAGIRTIPDGLLVEFVREAKIPFRINLLEYECYGEQKVRSTEKSTYLNSIIIPQLMRFAAAFSIITDEPTREKTIKNWVDRIISFIEEDEATANKVRGWVRELNPTIKEWAIDREIDKLLVDAFKSNLRVLLIIDELSPEQKSTIDNVVSSFVLANGTSRVQFSGYNVKLVQRINMLDNLSEYALTVQ